MPIIIVEGPDESGKTTLAVKLREALDPIIRTEYQRSPVKEFGWTDQYNSYTIDLANVTQNHLVVQDRVPEISEAIYGMTRDEIRTHGWVYEAGPWFHELIFLIFCEGPAQLEKGHKDAQGLNVEPMHEEICLLYDYTYKLLEATVSLAKMPDFRVWKYDRLSPGSEAETYWEISHWLSTRCFPQYRVPIRHAMSNLMLEVKE